jgi:hypothetical protein
VRASSTRPRWTQGCTAFCISGMWVCSRPELLRTGLFRVSPATSTPPLGEAPPAAISGAQWFPRAQPSRRVQ